MLKKRKNNKQLKRIFKIKKLIMLGFMILLDLGSCKYQKNHNQSHNLKYNRNLNQRFNHQSFHQKKNNRNLKNQYQLKVK